MHKTNKYVVGDTMAVLFCSLRQKYTVAVTIDRDDLDRVLAHGFWRVNDVYESTGRLGFYCACSRGGENKKYTLLHRLVMNAPNGVPVDHIYRRTLDNRKSQLRFVSGSLNAVNSKDRRNKYGRCVRKTAYGTFNGRVNLNGKRVNLGTFKDPKDAELAVRDFLKKIGAEYPAALGVTHA